MVDCYSLFEGYSGWSMILIDSCAWASENNLVYLRDILVGL